MSSHVGFHLARDQLSGAIGFKWLVMESRACPMFEIIGFNPTITRRFCRLFGHGSEIRRGVFSGSFQREYLNDSP